MSYKCKDCGKIIEDEKNAIVRTLPNNSKEVICEECLAKSVGKSYFERRAMNKIGCLLPFLGIFTIFILPWQIGLIIFGITIIISLLLYKKNSSLFDEDMGIKNLKWCKNCVHFKKIKSWEANILSPNIISLENSDIIPCKIFTETKKTWQNFIKLDWGQRTTYPKNCSRWIKK